MTERRSIIVPQQDQIEVYPGASGYVVIKQTAPLQEDVVVVFSAIHAKAICEAIMAAAPQADQNRAEWIAEADDEHA